ncbi:hypothetical protein QFZ79_004161 [Arthrobacter sp. V4I6]|uniref:hypothetical protein n=1 Tax=unclassified Arthrobacter TaxID=235627 RepID=UPI002789F5A7|nr:MULTISPECIES: hypothetical protein [unclassified Arthrobacter]MDQ0821786.1 hypothetical protein [Arthrobacter sp. V1I7]MDQ0856050.1 hypothetical protein [Arthrobacter sp. V4I6]
MTRPDPNSPDPDSSDSRANQDDAVWLDLVARLEGSPGPEDPKNNPTSGPAGESAPARPFSDFDPLGLAGGPPIELSAKERLARTPEATGAPGAVDSSGRDAAMDGPEALAGPRDYEADDDDGAFVPEEPPSLAGADPMTVLAWLGAVGGPIALLMSAMFWRSAPLMAVLAIVAAFTASVVFLIMKLPGEKDEHDDGARV